MRKPLAVLAAMLAGLLAGSAASALTITYTLTMDGAQEVPGPGDPDGTASGTLTIDDSTGGVGTVSWSFTYANIAAPTMMHIHIGAAGVAGGIVVDLGVATSGGAGTLIDSTTTSMATAAAINADPTNYYVNIHNNDFPSGAVRGQLGVLAPEPAALVLLALGLAGLARFGRRMS